MMTAQARRLASKYRPLKPRKRFLKPPCEILQESLAETAKKNEITGKRALAQALVWRMARDREEGLALKKDKAIQNNERDIDLR